MQFGVFTVGDIAPDPMTGYTQSEAERIKNMIRVARRADEVGLDVFALGEHHNPPFVPSSPTTLLAYIAALTERIVLSTSVTLMTTNDPVKIAEDYAMLQHVADGRLDLMVGRGNTVPVYPWFGKDIRQGVALALENYNLLHRLWREDVVDWEGTLPHAAAGLHLDPAPAGRRAAVRLARLDPHPGDRRAGRLLRQRVLRQPHPGAELPLQAARRPLPAAVRALRPRHRRRRRSSASAACRSSPSARRTRSTPSGRTSRTTRCSAARGWRTTWPRTPLTVGSPQEVIDKVLTFQEGFGDYQRQLFAVDGLALPVEIALEQVELLGTEVVPGAAQGARVAPRARTCPTPRPTPRSSTAKYGDAEPRQPRPNPNRGDNLSGTSPYQDSDPSVEARLPGRSDERPREMRLANEAWEALFRAQATLASSSSARATGATCCRASTACSTPCPRAPDGLRMTELVRRRAADPGRDLPPGRPAGEARTGRARRRPRRRPRVPDPADRRRASTSSGGSAGPTPARWPTR